MKTIWKEIKYKYIAGVLAALTLAIISYVFSLNPFSLIHARLTKTFIVPLWGLILIGIVPISLAVSARLLIGKSRQTAKTSALSWRSYVEDMIFLILWQWAYFSSRISGNSVDDSIIENSLKALCPQCKRELKETRVGIPGLGTTLCMKCPNCDFVSGEFDGSYYELTQVVLAEIKGRIRSEEYKEDHKKSWLDY